MKEKRIDIEIHRLCEEIDYWKEEARRWKVEYEEMRKNYSKSINHSIGESKKTIGIVLNAVLDPESVINKNNAAIVKKRVKTKINK